MKRKIMIRLACIISLIFFMLFFNIRNVRSEFIFLKDGSIVSGTIVKDAATSITVQKQDKKLETIQRANILRILYTRLNLGKIHVQMRDGKNFEAYIVDEDQESYTFRKNLYKADEINVKRNEVLFIADRNPSGLKGVADTGEIALTWFPPYNPVKHYLVYHKEKSEKEYRAAIKSKRTSYTLTDLKSNTAYLIKTTAVDEKDEESLPSNELAIVTKNIPPLRPGKVTLKQELSKDKKRTVVKLEWEAAKDPDGTVKEYRLYKEENKGPAQIAKTGNTFYEIPAGIEPNDLFIRAVDDRGDESGDRAVFTGSWMHVRLGVSASYPFATLDNLVGYGFGGTAGIYFTGFLFNDLAFGADVGYLYWLSDRDLLNAMHMIPAILWAGWKFRVGDRFALIPAAHAGAVTMYSNYKSRGEDGVEPLEERNKLGTEFVFGGSLAFEFTIAEKIFLFVKGDYSVIFETREIQPFAGITAGAGIDL